MYLRSESTGHRMMVALLLVVAVLLPSGASAEVLPSDLLGGETVSSSESLREVAPDVTLPSGILETADGQMLWARAADKQRAMASTTKIMTAIVVLDSVSDLSEVVTVPAAASSIGEAGVGLRSGQELTVEALLEAMLVHSGNDAAIALAVHVGGSVDGFVSMMNEKAKALDLRHSSFSNPHGLDADGHHTSASDLATMSRYAMDLPEFRRMVGTKTVTVQTGSTTKRFEATNLLLGTFDGATGVKTGWTNDAGYCLVASAERNGIELFAVILGTKNETARFTQAKRLLEWGFAHYSTRQVTSAEETAALVSVSDYLDRTVAAVVAESAETQVFDPLGELTSRADVVSEVEAPVVKGQRLGTLTVSQGDRLIAQVPIIASEDVPRPGGWERFVIGVTRFWRDLFGGQKQAAPVTIM